MNKKFGIAGLVVILLIFMFHISNRTGTSKDTVNVYGWYGVMPRQILRDFEKETGIKVVYDVYDNNDTLETKLLATNSGYDVVFPSFIPYAARQMSMGVYSKLDLSLIPNIKNISGSITEKFKKIGGDINLLVPYFWGTVGIAYEENLINRIFPNEKIESYDILLDPEKIQKLTKYGVSFPEEYIDIFPQTNVYLGIEEPAKKTDKIDTYTKHFQKIRKYITKFSSNTMISDLLSGEVCIAIGSSDNAWRAMESADNVGKKIKYLLPKKGGILWTDCVGIPNKAPHKINAHKFLNYLLRPDVAAKIANFSGILVNISEATKSYVDSIASNQNIFPTDPKVLDSLIIGAPSKDKEDVKYDKSATRAWSQIRMNKFSNQEEQK